MLECYLEAVAAALLTAKVRQNARETDTFDTADSADAKDKTLHTFEKCHHCAVGLSYAAPQTHDAREHDMMWWRLRSQEKGCWFKQITVL